MKRLGNSTVLKSSVTGILIEINNALDKEPNIIAAIAKAKSVLKLFFIKSKNLVFSVNFYKL